MHGQQNVKICVYVSEKDISMKCAFINFVVWILKNNNRILYNTFNANSNFNTKGANGTEKYY